MAYTEMNIETGLTDCQDLMQFRDCSPWAYQSLNDFILDNH